MRLNYSVKDRLSERFLDILRAMDYKSGWELDVYPISWPGMYAPGATDFEVRVSPRLIITDVNTGIEGLLVGQPVSMNTRDSERKIVDLVFSAIRHTEIHEAEEWFTYHGHRVYNPHRNQADNEKVFELALGREQDMERMRESALQWTLLGEIKAGGKIFFGNPTSISQPRTENGSADTSSVPNSDTESSKVRRRPAYPSHE